MTPLPLNFGRDRGYNRNHQDAREGGEIPPLPRNCERPSSDCRRMRNRPEQSCETSQAAARRRRLLRNVAAKLNHWSVTPGRWWPGSDRCRC